MHKLLARQLQRSLGSLDSPPERWHEFVAAIGSAYEQADNDRLLLERSLDLASQELLERFQLLQADIAERQHARQELEQSLSLLRATLDATTDGILVVGRQDYIVDFNQQFLDMWRIPAALMASGDTGHVLEFVLRQLKDPAAFQATIDRMLAEPDGVSDDVLEFLDGRIFERRSKPQRIGGVTVGRVWSFRDVTAERKRAEEALRRSEEQLRQAQKMEAIGQLAGGVAHDFNNILTAINGFSELVLATISADDSIRPFVEEIAKAGERAGALTAQLLAFGRRQVLQPEILSLGTVVADMDKLLRRVIGEDIELTTVIDLDLGKVRADPGQLGQVILNLATNARDAMPTGGRLTLEVVKITVDTSRTDGPEGLRPGRYVVLRVADTGTGIDRKIILHIFDPFFTTKPVGKGSGLGLSTVYGIVKQSGGEIEVVSSIGMGTTFAIYLPRHEAPVEVAKPGVATGPVPQGRETLLLVEDEAPVRALATAVLKSTGHTVIAASHGEEALRLCDEFFGPIHLLLTDVVMPGMSGVELSEHIVARRPETKVLYMSGYTDDITLRHGVATASTPFLQKPFSPSALALKVREVLDDGG